MTYRVAIRNNETGELRFRNMGPYVPWTDSSHSWWTTGNYSCDCNREMAFEGDDEIDVSCSDGRFSAMYAELEDGTRIELDDK